MNNNTGVIYGTLITDYASAAKSYPKFLEMFATAVIELESTYNLPAFKHTRNMNVILEFNGSRDDELVAFTVWFFDYKDRMLFIGLIYVEPQYRRLGHAANMIDIIHMLAKTNNAKYIQAAVVSNNLPSVALHKSLLGDHVGLLFMKEVV